MAKRRTKVRELIYESDCLLTLNRRVCYIRTRTRKGFFLFSYYDELLEYRRWLEPRADKPDGFPIIGHLKFVVKEVLDMFEESLEI